jgi:hypothetical protein
VNHSGEEMEKRCAGAVPCSQSERGRGSGTAQLGGGKEG